VLIGQTNVGKGWGILQTECFRSVHVIGVELFGLYNAQIFMIMLLIRSPLQVNPAGYLNTSTLCFGNLRIEHILRGE